MPKKNYRKFAKQSASRTPRESGSKWEAIVLNNIMRLTKPSLINSVRTIYLWKLIYDLTWQP